MGKSRKFAESNRKFSAIFLPAPVSDILTFGDAASLVRSIHLQMSGYATLLIFSSRSTTALFSGKITPKYVFRYSNLGEISQYVTGFIFINLE
jgi:hypothetical protein